MFAAGDLQFLSAWCTHRGLRWAPGACERPSMLLEQCHASGPWQRMVLSRDRQALRLTDETGTLLAEASTLPALLDAVDGGVAEADRPSPGLPSPAACAGLATNVVL